MKKLLIATGNPAKFQRYSRALKTIPELQVLSTKDINLKLKINETGKNGKENALLKARAYSEKLKDESYYILAVDEELYVRELEEDKQLGLYIRRCIGKNASDEELLQYFLETIRPLPGDRVNSEFISHIIVISPDGNEFYDKQSVKCQLFKKPELPILKGYPLDSLVFFPQFNKHIKDITDEEFKEKEEPVRRAILDLVQKAFSS